MSDTSENRRRGERLKALREAKGWTQRQLADATGLDAATVSRVELGKKARLETVALIIATLGAQTGDVIADDFAAHAAMFGLDARRAQSDANAEFGRLTSRSSDAKRSSMPREVRGMDEMRELLTNSEWAKRLKKNQLLGLALLIDGTEVDVWRARAALELMFSRRDK